MKKKFLFKKNNNNNLYYILSLLIFIFLIFYYIVIKKNPSFVTVPSNLIPFYIIPYEKGGEEIENQDKKGLHLSDNEYSQLNIEIEEHILYSIQIFTDEIYSKVNFRRNELLNLKNEIFLSNNLFIASLDSSFSKEFYLLHNNFKNRNIALNYCKKNPFFLDKCVIVNVQNLN